MDQQNPGRADSSAPDSTALDAARERPSAATAADDVEPWRRPELPVDERVADLLPRMTLGEKLAQLVGVWVSAADGADGVAPHQHEQTEEPPAWPEAIRLGLGQLTRTFGTTPVDPATGAGMLADAQREIVAAGRFGIPAMAHEECLAGFAAWKATVYPVPLAWGASFDPELVQTMAAAIGADLRSVGVHQGLAPVLDVVRDARWGRVEETIGEDPFLVGTIGAAYVRGVEGAGVVATLKHFAGYSASRAGRNLAPAALGRRELADVILPPFEMALRHGGARSVMHSYAEIDGVPVAADEELLTDLLRDQWGFAGVVVADYFGVAFLHRLHGTAADEGEAAEQALTAGVDVELPTVRCFGEPLAERLRAGLVPESLVDRAVTRVLRQKCELGLLDPDWSPEPPALRDRRAADDPGTAESPVVDLDPPANRRVARRLAEESVVLLSNRQEVLPLRDTGTVAVLGPLADDVHAMLGCYSFPAHVGVSYPDLPVGVEIRTVLDVLRAELGTSTLRAERGCAVDDDDRSGIGAAVAAARDAELALVVVGDHSGLFGRGTSGEGCDATDLALPGVQGELLAAVVDTGVPTVAVVISGRPYALGAVADRLAAAVQAFLPGEEGAAALVGVLTGRVDPSGRLPVSLPATPHGQPATYLTPPLGLRSQVSSADPTPLFPFGHGLSYTTFRYSALLVRAVTASADDGPSSAAGVSGGADVDDAVARVSTDGVVEVSCVVANVGDRDGVEVVQLYLRDPVAQVTRPVRQLAGFARVALRAGTEREVRFRLHADRTSFTGRAGHRLVEPGLVEVHVGASSADLRLQGEFVLTGSPRQVGPDRVLDTPVTLGDERPATTG
ncbi:beta-xylosidase [Actinoalloteichus hoggarensis]|uniref:Periplasmic beta-glucosidase n=1 Tax=Actinoalloteichus hoggarensis TaxID=1470176 RepID=A0A221W553_9PSEU|nr:glycoside hydrolase family 3 N-terminal domain-containing protein [Actinoalloteichus hoggarensis]ASO21005.1 Periplasmic beta-glucosidase precursor [Actinoalloteichus hoggarensis]MBB5920936.1 beta-xylosidase [Actinoalloteichus hoggarensis]